MYSERPQVDFLPHWGTETLWSSSAPPYIQGFSTKSCSSAAYFDSSGSSDTYWEKDTPVEPMSLAEEVTRLHNACSICDHQVISNMYKKVLEIINVFHGPAVQFYMSSAWRWVCLPAEQKGDREHQPRSEITLAVSSQKWKIQQSRIRHTMVSVTKNTSGTENLRRSKSMS